MIAILALVMQVLMALVTPADSTVVVIPAKPAIAPAISEDAEWSEFRAIAVAEYADEFTVLFNSYSYKLSKNGRSMVNGKFVKMGV